MGFIIKEYRPNGSLFCQTEYDDLKNTIRTYFYENGNILSKDTGYNADLDSIDFGNEDCFDKVEIELQKEATMWDENGKLCEKYDPIILQDLISNREGKFTVFVGNYLRLLHCYRKSLRFGQQKIITNKIK